MRRLGLVPARQQAVDGAQPALGRDDEVGPPGARAHVAARVGHGLQRADDGGADGDDAAAPAPHGADEARGRLRHRVALGGRALVALGGGEARVQRHRGHEHAAGHQPRDELRGERPRRARHLGAPRVQREGRLVVREGPARPPGARSGRAARAGRRARPAPPRRRRRPGARATAAGRRRPAPPARARPRRRGPGARPHDRAPAPRRRPSAARRPTTRRRERVERGRRRGRRPRPRPPGARRSRRRRSPTC